MPRHFLRRLALAVSLLAATLPALAALDLSAPIPVGPQVKVGKLPNGLTYYIHKNSTPAQRLELRLVVKAGSVLEDDDQRGLAHFVEHMAFNGSTHFKRQELVNYMQAIGVKMGADLNAYTSFDETVYILPIPTDRKDNVDKGFAVLEDWAHGLTLNDADIDKERDIVLEELRLRKGAGERLNKVVMPKLFNGSKYAERLPIGTEEVLRNFKPDTLRRFYREWYRPDLMAVVVVGDIEPSEAEKQIRAHFAGLTNPAPERERNYPDISSRLDTEALVVTDKEASGNAVFLRYPVAPAPARLTYGSYREKKIESLFSTMLNQRLLELTMQPDAPFLGGITGITRFTARYQAYHAVAALGPRGAEPAIAALVQENMRARKFGFSEAELERARKNLLRSYERMYNERNTTNSASYVGEYLRNFLAGETLPGTEAEYRLVQELLPGITLEEVNEFARKTIPADSGKLVVYSGVERAGTPAPTREALLAAARMAEQGDIGQRKDKALATRLMERPPTPGSIVEESEDKTLGLTRLTLSNGVKVILKPTDFHRDQVMLSGARFGGQMLFDEKDIPNTRYASQVAASMGLKDFSPADVGKILAGKSASASTLLADYTDEVRGNSGAGIDDIEAMLQMLWLRFDGVRRDETLYASYMDLRKEALRNRQAQPEMRFRDAIVDTLYNKHPYEPRELTLDDVARMSLDRSIEIYRQRFSSAKGMTFVLVGSFDVAKLKPLLATYLATLPTPELTVAYRDVGLRPVTGVVKKEVLGGVEQKSTLSVTFTGPAAWSEQENLRMAALIEVMNLRVYEVLRTNLGLIYGGNLSGAVRKIPYEHYVISGLIPTGPEKMDKVVAALFEQIERLKTTGPDEAELAKVKTNWRQRNQRSLRENVYWMQRLQVSVLDGTDPGRILKVMDDVDAMTAADIRAAAQRYFKTDNYVQVVLNPERPAAVAAAASQAGN
ncbi:insulinase family protein [Massilia agilis]|uniref:Insulinase family protein n=1 Tax=Massilia agilis TaxID=1811226 RepID=A0ABT2DG16_9BURK|nr:M16 family metallopeptidase [Massilia agilis]MCS0810267.1 insulinase family protein [Massilia agilis]